MPPKAKTSKKHARSPAATQAAGDKTQTRSSKRTKKDASVDAADETQAQEDVDVDEAAEKTTAAETDKPEETSTKTPSFHGNFDLYAMQLPFLNSVFTPQRDYAALLKTIRTYQAKPDNSAQIFLPEDLTASPDGRFRSGAIRDPLECMPFDIALESLALTDSVMFSAREGKQDAFYAESTLDTSGITASVALEDSHCGIASTHGTFKMRRAWVSEDGTDEVFEGFFKIDIVYSGLYRRKCFENSLNVGMPFWGIRARIGKDGKEVGLGPGL